jgi:transcriptional regulator of acetoin/glycerol metabolism
MTEQAEQKTTVLVVDDDRLLRRQLHWALVERHRVLEAETRIEAVDLLQRERVDVVISDLHLPPDLDGIEEGWPSSRPRAASARPCPSSSSRGATTSRPRSKLSAAAPTASSRSPSTRRRSRTSSRRPRASAARSRSPSPALRASTLQRLRPLRRHERRARERTLKQARAVADTSSHVLITGENGTGKEVIARTLHEESFARVEADGRGQRCAALPEGTFESELFGHVKGAFTDAKSDRVGPLRTRRRRHALPRRDRRTYPSICRPKLLRVIERATSSASALRRRAEALTCESSPRRTATSKGGRLRSASAKTSSTASTSCRFTCRRCASGARTSRSSPRTSPPRPPRSTTAPAPTSTRRSSSFAGVRLARQRARA